MLHVGVAATFAVAAALRYSYIQKPKNIKLVKLVTVRKLQSCVKTEISNFDHSKLKHVVTIPKNNLQVEIRNFNKTLLQHINCPKQELILSTKEKVHLGLNNIKLKKIEQNQKIQKKTIVDELRTKPHLTKINPLLIHIQKEITRRNKKRTFLTDIQNRNYVLKNRFSHLEVIELSDSEN